MNRLDYTVARPAESAFAVNKVLKNTYMLLSATLLFSALMAAVSVVVQMPPMTHLLSLGGALLLIWLVLPRTANSAAGLGVVFAITGRKDFSFMGGFLFAGLLVVLIAALANIFLAMPAISLAISAVVIMLMSGFILYDTSRMVNGGETNYITMTVSLYLSIYNIFISLLQILGIFSGDD